MGEKARTFLSVEPVRELVTDSSARHGERRVPLGGLFITIHISG